MPSPMNNLAHSVLDYFWYLNFSEEDDADPDVTGRFIEELVHSIETAYSDTERNALMVAASERLATWLRPPDEHGYSPRALLTQEQRAFLEAIARGHFSGDDGDAGDG
jgi:hypothetical protein